MNNHPRYVQVFAISLFGFSISFKIGNPMWFIQEFKKLKEGGEQDAKSCEKRMED